MASVLQLLALLVLGAAAAPRQAPVVGLAFNGDGTLLFVARHDSVEVRSTQDGAVRRVFRCDVARVTSLALSPDGRALAVGGGKPGDAGEVLVLDPHSGEVLKRAGGFDDLVTSVAFSADGASLAAASADHSARLFEVRGRALKPGHELTGHTAAVLAVAFAPDGKSVVTAGADRSIKVWQPATGRLVRTMGNHTAPVHCLAVRPGDEKSPFTCASGSDDQTARVWRPGAGRMVRIVRGHDGPVLAVAYARDGAVLFSAGGEGVLRVIDDGSDAVLGKWKAHDDWIYAVAASTDGKLVVTGDWSGDVRGWAWDATAKTHRRLW